MSLIYLIECRRDYDTVYKIGFSKSPNKRLDNLQTGNDGELRVLHKFESSHNQKVERTLQRFFAHKKINREWFRLDLEDVQNFNTICQKIENNLTTLTENGNLL